MERKFEMVSNEPNPCCMALQARIDALENGMEKVCKKLDEMQKTNANMNAKVLGFMNQLSKNMVEPKVELPIMDELNLQSLDNKIGESPNNYLQLFKRMLIPGGISKNLKKKKAFQRTKRKEYKATYRSKKRKLEED
ncbi:uncharacterized protein Dana_GF27863 [Drosophila ananassae]|uniref:Uncharacterized protein n=1 Tax=Drosophila ananassae TaxID=7217 RepID=A0A0P8XRT3_DROAN|nr:uncharacterized protein LOC26515272 [Drosophila ananassae]KPU77289.1 uncharacterized protein Dana_GF27863 [Drosophila ananassae]